MTAAASLPPSPSAADTMDFAAANTSPSSPNFEHQGIINFGCTQESMNNSEQNENGHIQVGDEAHQKSYEVSKPYLGMTFSSEYDAYTYYNLYAKVVGFSVRKDYPMRSRKNNQVIRRRLVCSKQGHKNLNDKRSVGREVKRRRDVRDDCKAHLIVGLKDNGKWEVKSFFDEHTHAMATPSKVCMLRSHQILSSSSKGSIEDLHNRGFGPSKIVKILKFSGDSSVTDQNCKDHLKAIRQNNIGKECMNVIAYFQNKTEEDEGFFSSWELDENYTVRSFFWADSRARDSYITFGDVLIFDTTYRTNKFRMPFAPFTGVNHHRQSTLFGCALLADETENTFIWLFETFLKCMCGKHPLAIITDQDVAMGNAINKVFPNTRHRYCIWHIRKNAMSHLQNLYSRGNFKKEFEKWIYESIDVEDFEERWIQLKQKYDIPDGHWIESMYNKRHFWVPVYLNDVFFAGMRTTQRSESINSFFDGYVNSNTSLTEFVFQYDQALSSRREAEEREDFKNFHSTIAPITGSPLEKHAIQLYTQKIFWLLQNEFREFPGLWSRKISEDSNKEVYSIYVAGFEDNGKIRVEYIAQPSIYISCSCKKFEQDGIFCAHIIVILNEKRICSIPEQYILHRWTTSARYANARVFQDNAMTTSAQNVCTSTSKDSCLTPSEIWSWRTNIWKAQEMGLRSRKNFAIGMESLTHLIKQLSVSEDDDNAIEPATKNSNTNLQGLQYVIRDPNRVKSKGRPRKLARIKSSLEISMSQPESRKISCKICGKQGHSTKHCALSKGQQTNSTQ